MRRTGLVELFGPFVEPPGPREDRARNDATQVAGPLGGAGTTRDLDLHLEVGEGTDLAPTRSHVLETAAGSIVAHLAGLMAVVVVPLLLPSALPPPADEARVFFVKPIVAPPPPPPPPPPPGPAARAKAATSLAPRAEVDAKTFVAPVEIPTGLRPEEGLDLGIGGGTVGGVEGGVPGGVLGGVVGGLPDVPPPPVPVEPLRAGVHVKEPVKVKHTNPVYPEVAAAARVSGIVIIEAVIDESGRVCKTTLLRGMPLLSEAVLEAVKQWRYTPTLLNGVPIRVTIEITVRFELEKASDPSST